MLVGDRHMFPLKFVQASIGDNYFMSADGKVWSTRASKKPVELGGSKTKSGVYFRFGNGWNATNFKLQDLERQARAHAFWLKETTGVVKLSDVAEAAIDRPVGRKRPTADTVSTKATSVDAGIKARGSIIGRVHKGHLVFGSEPKIHTSEQSVKDEMVRLANTYPGVKFVRLNIAGSVVAGGVVWE